MEETKGADLSCNLNDEELQLLERVGYEGGQARAGTSVIVDQGVRCATSSDPGLEILPLSEAVKRYSWVQDLMFGLIAPEENDHVRQVAETIHEPVGHFIWVKEGAKVRLPVQSFCVLETPQARQFTHNLTVIDKDGELEMICGSSVPTRVHAGHHISISECYVREGAKCRSVSIENWAPDMEVHSFSRCLVEAGAEVNSLDIMMTPIAYHYCESKSFVAENARCNAQAVIVAPPDTKRILDSEIYLKGAGAQSENLARMVSAGGDITNKALLIGESAGVKGFLGCDGLKLADEGQIVSLPGLAAKSVEAELSHEASVGMISKEKMAYLMASGIEEDAARDLIIQGFLNLKEQILPDAVRDQVQEMIAAAKSGSM